jgi:transcriptional regulator with XRE-family HTH domain
MRSAFVFCPYHEVTSRMLPRIRPLRTHFAASESPYGDLGSRIAERRESLGLTKQDLARKLGTTVSWVIDLERSGWRWRNKSLIRVSQVLDMPQLELAIAAGVISDLPAYPARSSVNPDIQTSDRLMVQEFLGENSGEAAATREELITLIRSLDLHGLQFVLAVTRQIADR